MRRWDCLALSLLSPEEGNWSSNEWNAVRQNEIKKLQTRLLAPFQPHFSGTKPDGPDAASSLGSPEAASCRKQGKSSHCVFVEVVSLC